jgi:hypothetical protein
MNKLLFLTLNAMSVSVFTTPIAAQAFSIAAPGTEGLNVVVAGGGSVTATYDGNSASYSNDLYLMLDAQGIPGNDGITTNDLFIFNNQTSAVGSNKILGTFADGTVLNFRLHVNNTNTDFFSGAASLNPDGVAHARVQGGFGGSTTTLVSFEDLNGGPYNYNDLSFTFTPTRSATPSATSVPEPFTIIGTVVGSTAAMRMRKKLKSVNKA